MSNVIYIASDMPITARPNPHERMVSVNEALALGVKVADFLLADDFDRDKPNVILIADREVNINVDDGTITDGDFDDDFSVWLPDDPHDLPTDKKYCAFFDCVRYTDGRGAQFIDYLKQLLQTAGQIELWHVWLGSEPPIMQQITDISINELTADCLRDFLKTDVAFSTDTAFCLRISR